MEKKINKIIVFIEAKDIFLIYFKESKFIKMLKNQGYDTSFIKNQEIDSNCKNAIFADIENKTVRFADIDEHENKFNVIDFINEEFYNCGTNKSLFLSLAMKSNGTDANQWFIDHNSKITIFNHHHNLRDSFSRIYSNSLHDRAIQDYNFIKMNDKEIIDAFKCNEIINQGESYFFNTKLVDKELILYKLLLNGSKLVSYNINDDYLCVNDNIVYSATYMNNYSPRVLFYYDQFISVAKINPFSHKNQLFKVLHKNVNAYSLSDDKTEQLRGTYTKGTMIEMKFDYCLVEGMILANINEIIEYYEMPF